MNPFTAKPFIYLPIHSFNIYSANPLKAAKKMGQSQLIMGKKWNTTWTNRQSITGLRTFAPMCNSESSVDMFCMSLGCVRKSAFPE